MGSSYPQQDSISLPEGLKYDMDTLFTTVSFKETRLNEFKTQEEFDYIEKVEKESWWSRFKNWINAKYNQFLAWLFGEYEPNSLIAFPIRILPYVLLFLLLGLVLWLFSRLNPGRHILEDPRNSEVFLSEEEELVKNEDLNSLIQTAIRNSEFRLAVRYYYLKQLKKLDQSKLIDYQYQKTNHDYLEEIGDWTVREHFNRITKLYDFIWYGSFEVTENDFALAEKTFLRMETLLKSVKSE